MDIILEKIPEVVKLIEFTSYIDNREFENETNDILHSIYRDELKLRFLTDLLNEVLTKKEEHLEGCNNLKGCHHNKRYRESEFFLQQEFDKLGADINANSAFENFNSNNGAEKFSVNEIIDIKRSLDKLLLGQEVIYDDLKKEIEELKELVHSLSKKNWLELVKGKLVDMVLNEVISKETFNQLCDAVGFMQMKNLLN